MRAANDLVFSQVFTSSLYQLSDESPYSGWCGFLLTRGKQAGTEMALADTFLQGIYLFAIQSPLLSTESATDTFIMRVRTAMDLCFTDHARYNGPGCMWIEDVTNPVLGDDGKSYALTFGLQEQGGDPVFTSDFVHRVGMHISFNISSGDVVVGLYENGLQITSNTEAIGFSPEGFGKAMSVDSSALYIPFQGKYRGCILFSGVLTPREILQTPQLPGFRFGCLKYAHGDGVPGPGKMQTYPVLRNDTCSPCPYTGSIDPLDTTNENMSTVDIPGGKYRTCIAFTSAENEVTVCNSWMTTDINKPIDLVPLGGNALPDGPEPYAGGLVFMRDQVHSTTKHPPVYMSLAGEFGMKVDDPVAQHNMLCGLAGSESIRFTQYTNSGAFDVLEFLPYQKAYVPVFPLKSTSMDCPDSENREEVFQDDLKTSWVKIYSKENGGLRYQAQPNGSPLFISSGNTNPNSPIVLDAYNPGVEIEKPEALPFVPYAGLAQTGLPSTFGAGEVAAFEGQILAMQRKKIISSYTDQEYTTRKAQRSARRETAVAEQDDAVKMATTPQGFIMEFLESDTGVDYTKILLANYPAAEDGAYEFAFGNPDIELQNLFQSNQLFAVITNPTHLGTPVASCAGNQGKAFFENRMNISGWEMTANVGEGTLANDYRNVMIIKFCSGTVEDRVNNPVKWTQPDDFSIPQDTSGNTGTVLAGLSQWLQNYISSAIENGQEANSLYSNFSRIVTDPNWNGILVLRADTSPSDIPDQIKGLSAGIDSMEFEAHHFGMSVSKVKVDGNTISIDGNSSTFGLIDYQYPQYKQHLASGGRPGVPLGLAVDGDYGFTVLQLQVLFENAAMAGFSSYVQLSVNALFGSSVVQTYNQTGPLSGNGVVLRGAYQMQGGSATYVFKQTQRTIFALSSNILQAVGISQIQFNTLTAQSGGNNPKIISRFQIWGALDFAEVKDQQGAAFDVLSFGSPPGAHISQQGVGLAFSNMTVTLSSPVATPGAVVFKESIGNLAFDPSVSTIRGAGLYRGLSLQLERFFVAVKGKNIADYGYLPVQSKIPMKTISEPWYGLVCKVMMGGPGGLASAAGFHSYILLGWSPETNAGDSNYTLCTGLSLPGAAPGAKCISLQGILKVDVSRIVLQYEPGKNSSAKSFTLRLDNIGLKFLGIAKLPPGATIQFFLFGDPNNRGSLGWYAAYIEDQLTNTKKKSIGTGLHTLSEPIALDAIERRMV